MIQRNGVQHVGDERFAALAQQLESAFSIPYTEFANKHTDSYVQLEQIYDAHYTNYHLQIWQNCDESFTLQETDAAIRQLKLGSDPGPMGITSSYLIYNIEKFAPLLQHFLSKVLEYGVIPPEWKASFIVPIPRKGNPNMASNYRGIALQSAIPKLFDKLLLKKLCAISMQ